ncbi:MAG TPA: hypothetical protein VMN39_05965, partial [Longimicrobiaceae bacterium]|nr:hypothetical protein [Longimicrobiaceae bacterium]
REYVRYPATGVRNEEIELEVGDSTVPASYIRPRGSAPIPGWIVLHGITVPGRHHKGLQRFAHALAASGAAVLIPEVPAWRRLQIDRRAGDRTIAAATTFLASRPDVLGPLPLVGFSFGATQALTSSTLPGIREHIGSVVSFGGYCSLERTLRFMMTGEHEWEGVRHRLAPDPYGRWIVVANYLRHVPELAHLEGLIEAAAELAAESGRQGIYAGDPRYDPLKETLGSKLSRAEKPLWDVIAAPSGVTPPAEPARELADLLVEAALRIDPEADPANRLREVDAKVVLAHGHTDQLIPYTEALRLHATLPARADVSVSITRLFAHSREAPGLGFLHYPRELVRYVTLLNRALTPG